MIDYEDEYDMIDNKLNNMSVKDQATRVAHDIACSITSSHVLVA